MERNVLDTINMRELGRELQEARRRKGLTQEEAASIIDVARTTMTAIEKGERRIKAGELVKLAQAYGRQVSDFVRSRPRLEPFLRVQFRGPYAPTDEDTHGIQPYIDMLEELCRNYIELEDINDSPLPRLYPREYDASRLPIEQAAESLALEERNRLGLGDGPLPILRDVLEQDVGLRVFYVPLPSKFSAIYFYTDQAGGCIGINSLHPEERRRWSLAHDYCHFLANRHQPTIFVVDGYQRRPESERLADSFAFYFLMPTAGLTRRFTEIRRTAGKVTPADLCTLAHYYGVSVEALTRRLEMMKLLATGTWDSLRAAGFKIREAQQQLGLEPIPAQDTRLPMRYQYLALTALNKELISEGHFAHLLGVDRLEARRIADTLREQTGDIMDDGITARDLTHIAGA